MRKKGKRLIAAVGMFVLVGISLTFVSHADSASVSVSTDGDVSEYFEDFSSIIPEESSISVEDGALVGEIGLEGILNEILGAIRGGKSEYFSFFITILGFAIISVVCELNSFSSSMQEVASVGVYVIMAVVIYPKMYGLFFDVQESLSSISSFFGAAIPVLTAITTASGAVQSAGVQAMNMNATLGIVGTLAVKILLPLSFSILALSLVFSFGESGASSVMKAIRNLF
ncbi:MAG: hypothetical protein J6Q68_03920, partial [Clostridia bacterium]|nr:hypothetical protein [Clostridia bacterium]